MNSNNKSNESPISLAQASYAPGEESPEQRENVALVWNLNKYVGNLILGWWLLLLQILIILYVIFRLILLVISGTYIVEFESECLKTAIVKSFSLNLSTKVSNFS